MPETLTTHFRSVIAFGRIRIVEDPEEKRSAILALAERFAPGLRELAEKETAESWNRMNLFALDIEHITGKEARELMQQRRNQK